MDSGEFAAAAHVLGIPHAPGYPLYVLLAKLFTYLPVSEIAFRVNFFSAIFGALSVLLLYHIFMKLLSYQPEGFEKTFTDDWWRKKSHSQESHPLPQNLSAALSASVALLFAFSSTFWYESVVAEEYTLYVFFMAVMLWLLLLWQKGGAFNAKWFYLMAFTAGLSLSNHLITLASSSALIFYFWSQSYPSFWNRRTLLVSGFLFTLGISIYLFLPLRSAGSPQMDWGDPETPRMFQYVITLEETTQMYPGIKRFLGSTPWYVLFAGGMWQNFFLFLPFALFALLALDLKKETKKAVRTFVVVDILLFAALMRTVFFSKPHPMPEVLLWIAALHAIVLLFVFILWLCSRTRFLSNKRNILMGITLFLVLLLPYALLLIPHWDSYLRTAFNRWILADMLLGQFGKPSLNAVSITYLLLGIGGGFALYRKSPLLFFCLFYILFMSLPYNVLANFSHNNPPVQERHKIVSYLVIAIFTGFGMKGLFRQQKSLIFASALLPVFPLISHFHQLDKSQFYYPYDFALNTLKSVQRNSLLFVKGTENTFPLWYVQLAEKKRPDVAVVYTDALSNPWYQKFVRVKHPDILHLPDIKYDAFLLNIRKWQQTSMRERGEKLNRLILKMVEDNKTKRPVYYTGGSTRFVPEAFRGKNLVSVGLAYRVLDEGKNTEQAQNALVKNVKQNYKIRGLNSNTQKDWMAQAYLSAYGDAHYALGLFYLEKRKQKDAIQEFKTALRYNPKHLQARTQLGLYAYSRGDMKTAIRHLRQAQRISPYDPALLNNLGSVLLSNGEVNTAISYFQKAIKLSPDYQNAHFNLGVAYIKKEWLQRARTQFQKAVQLNPKDPDAWFNYALTFKEEKLYAKAEEQLNKAISLFPKDMKFYLALASMYHGMTRKQDAITILEKAVRIDPQNLDAKAFLEDLRQP